MGPGGQDINLSTGLIPDGLEPGTDSNVRCPPEDRKLGQHFWFKWPVRLSTHPYICKRYIKPLTVFCIYICFLLKKTHFHQNTYFEIGLVKSVSLGKLLVREREDITVLPPTICKGKNQYFSSFLIQRIFKLKPNCNFSPFKHTDTHTT